MVFSTNDVGETGYPLQKNEIRALPNAIYKKLIENAFKKSKCKSWNYETLRRKYKKKASWHYIWQWFLMTPKAQATKEKIDKLDIIKI